MTNTLYGLFIIIAFASPMALASAFLFFLAASGTDRMSPHDQRSGATYQPMVILTSRSNSTDILPTVPARVDQDVIVDTHLAA